MKRILILALMLLLATTATNAEDLGVKIISGETIMDTTSLDDIQLGETYTLDGCARVKPLSFEFEDFFLQYAAGEAGNNSTNGFWYSSDGPKDEVYYGRYDNFYHWYQNFDWMNSTTNAEFAFLLVDVTNMQKQEVLYSADVKIKVVFDDEYEFEGWIRQFNYDYDTVRNVDEDYEDGLGKVIRAAIDPADEEPISPVYTGHYVFGCTIPNVAVEGTEPLRMEINIGDNELTYNIRK